MRRATSVAVLAISAFGVAGGCTAFGAASDAPVTDGGGQAEGAADGAADRAAEGGVDAPIAEAGTISFLGISTGSAGPGFSIASESVPPEGDRFLAVISTKGPAAVVTVSGLLLTWTRIDVQCTGRNQSALEVWTAGGPAKAPGSVTATFGTAVDEGSALAVARYGGVRSFGGSKRKNTNGGDGACIDGSDSGDFNFSVSTKGASGAVAFVGIALRGRMLSPAGGAIKRAEVHSPTSSGAGVGILDGPGPTLGGSFDTTVDWAVIGFELLP